MCKWRIALIPIMPLSRLSLVSRLSELSQASSYLRNEKDALAVYVIYRLQCRQHLQGVK